MKWKIVFTDSDKFRRATFNMPGSSLGGFLKLIAFLRLEEGRYIHGNNGLNIYRYHVSAKEFNSVVEATT